MKRFENVAIVGVGLIGGSIGLALRKLDLALELFDQEIERRPGALAPRRWP